jgi:co-chaperonin GroES (HSP10)
MALKPIGKYIVIKTVDEELKTESGLILSGEDVNQMRYKRGLVIEAGTDVPNIKKDDDIYYDKAHGFTMLIDDKQYTIITERDVVVVL